ncbi:MAG: hypothetical protein M1832_000927 [Thelocarpon impressellum]|nr:MAG: hypothetical protein M1832_000927 [Thelocarpon impressellum]
MPVAAGPAQTAHVGLPSFISVFGHDANMTGPIGHATASCPATPDSQTSTEPSSSSLAPSPSTVKSAAPDLSGDGSFQIQYQHRGSASTSDSTSICTSDSTDSSPTTTVSTTDSSTMTDPSPSSSPESPVSIVPLSSFAAKNAGEPAADDGLMSPPLSPFPGYNQPFSPGKKPRNTKNLSLNMAAPTRQPPRPPLRVKTASATDASLPQSAPPSPSFIMPVRPPRKRSSNLGLTIQTPSLAGLPEVAKGLRIVPPTPSLALPKALRHHQSSPSLSLFSPTGGVQGGMQLPAFSSAAVHRPRQMAAPSRNSSIDSIPSTISERTSPELGAHLDELEEEDDELEAPPSQEVKSPAYPAGPVCIYDPYVYLYLEPSDQEASRFDVVFNVAREVRNPFAAPAVARKLASEVRGASPDEREMPEPQSSTSVDSFATAYEVIPDAEDVSPTTPKAPPKRTEPEYIHVPWDHNTNIVDDLLRLVEEIDDRVRQGKRVLIHCQCGVSRSASLVVAYGLYKDPGLTVQEAYDAVKRRSRWIGPNMSLIYQLSEFRTKLLQRTNGPQHTLRGWRTGGGLVGLMGGGRCNTISTVSPTKRPSLTAETFDSPRSEPLTAPLPEERDRTPVCASPVSPFTVGTEGLGTVSPGPSSAPPEMSTMPVEGRSAQTEPTQAFGLGLGTPSGYGDTGFTPALRAGPAPSGLRTFRAQDSVRHLQLDLPAPADDAPPTPALLSPRAIEFTSNPFRPIRPTAPLASFGLIRGPRAPGAPTYPDPRSPPARGEAPIVRSIFDVL